MRRFFSYLAPVLLYAAVIFFLSSSSNVPGLPGPEGMDKVAHLAEYAMFGVLLARAFCAYGLAPLRALLLAPLAGGLYGAVDEFHQSFTPGRTVELLDFTADLAGSAVGALVWYAVVAALWGFRTQA